MGITDFFSDLLSSVSFVQEVHAEAPAEDDDKEEGGDDESKDDKEGDDDKEDGGDDEKEEGDDDKGDDEEEEEEEEEEPVDPKPKLEEDCAKSAQCAGYKHHFDECVERVTSAHENPDHKAPHEDCVEEFFHLQHCATQCAAPKLWKALK
ncbi:ubiquinol-cytochrome c reductase subunit 6 [Exophiala viscosa]|uniref:Cytochrome b-c1 complex subunit 6, mitochondrial n=1 Tax=Exophiala viscosa TaxID=2486360 RepID=A0AAN6DVV4_9EURO|nr:ubiquinol-cytochrome c reductase subunit 6 [Exophiala viscosa]KAI1626131.1 ubiquinol-cytochrome c reductase subunit 6 [Exophiala viscosa]